MEVTNRIGLGHLTCPKDLRHLFATSLQAAGVDPMVRRDIMGHTSLEMTAHYTHTQNGTRQPPISQIQVDGSEQTIEYVGKSLQAGIKLDICWRDAGAGATTWYPSDTGPNNGKEAWLFPVRASGSGIAYNVGRFATDLGVFVAGTLVDGFGGDFSKIGTATGLIYALGMVAIWWASDTSHESAWERALDQSNRK